MIKKYRDFFNINESKAEDFDIGDNIRFFYNGKRYRGIVSDHFGDGLFVSLEKPLEGYEPDPGVKLSNFELYDGEESVPGFTIDNLSIDLSPR